METAVSSTVDAEPDAATGALLTSEIEILIVAVLEFRSPSLTRKRNESEPLYPADGR